MPSLKLKLSLLAVLTLAAIGLYFVITLSSSTTERDLMSEIKSAQVTPPAPGVKDSGTGVAPVDVDGWVLLSKSYYHLNRMAQAQSAFEKARALGYTGNWQPLPRIDSFSQNSASSQNFASTINIRDYKIDGEANQSNGQVGETVSPPQ